MPQYIVIGKFDQSPAKPINCVSGVVNLHGDTFQKWKFVWNIIVIKYANFEGYISYKKCILPVTMSLIKFMFKDVYLSQNHIITKILR